MLKHTFFAVLMVFSLGLVKAQDSSVSGDQGKVMVVPTEKDGQYVLATLAKGNTPVQVDLLNAKGERLYSNRYNTDGYLSRRFDLSQQPSGTYTFRITQNGEATEQSFVNVSTGDRLEQGLSVVGDQSGRKFKLEMAAEFDEPYQVIVYDNSDNVLYETTVAKGTPYAKVFNLENVGSPAVTFVVATSSAVSSRKVILR